MPRTTRKELSGKVQTVLGIADPNSIGPTLMHEHLLWDFRSPKQAADPDQGPEITLCNCWKINFKAKIPRNLIFRCEDGAATAMNEMHACGGRTLVELTCGGLAPDPAGLAAVAKRSGINIVMGCGYYVDEYLDRSLESRTPEQFAKEMIDQVFEGAWGTSVRAGIIGEIGCQAPWTDLEKKIMIGALIAKEETGAALNVHPGRDPDAPQEIVKFIQAHGHSLERVVMSHIDRTIFDDDRLLRLAESGCVIELDQFGREQAYYPWGEHQDQPNDGGRVKMIKTLVDHGHRDRIVISHDIIFRTRLTEFGGHGYGYIFEHIVPMMRRHGLSESDIDAILVHTPKRMLTFA